MIEIKNVTKIFEPVKAVDNLTVAFKPGITGLVGENGAGKSTLLRLIAGIYDGDGGEILVDGSPASTPEAKALVFFLSDDPLYSRRANIQGTLDFYRGLFDVDVEKFNRIIDIFGLPRNKAVGNFSKGMKRQMFVALALSVNCPYLLLDEAFDGLDPLVIESIKTEIINASIEGKAVVISSHNIYALQRLVDRFVILSKGKLAKEGESGDIGTEFIKLQAVFSQPVCQQNIEDLGFKVASFRNVGSVTHIVLLGNDEAIDVIRDTYKPTFIERIQLDPDEVVALEMALARKGGARHA